MDESAIYFVDNCTELNDYIEILNWYRNLYHAESENTERGIVAKAINDLFNSLTAEGDSNHER